MTKIGKVRKFCFRKKIGTPGNFVFGTKLEPLKSETNIEEMGFLGNMPVIK